MFLYKIHVVQRLENSDHTDRTESANWCLQSIQTGRFFQNKVFVLTSASFKWTERLIGIMPEYWELETVKIKEKR